MRRLAVLLLGVSMLVAASGCCCGWLGHGYGTGYYSGFGACPSGNYGLGNPTVLPPQQGAFYNSYNTIQTGYPPAMPGPVAVSPVIYQAGYPQTAVVPLEALQTY